MLNKKGMTLLEVLISLMLFTFISVSLMRMHNRTVFYRKKVSSKIQDIKYNRNLLHIIRKDVRNTFYTQDMQILAHREAIPMFSNQPEPRVMDADIPQIPQEHFGLSPLFSIPANGDPKEKKIAELFEKFMAENIQPFVNKKAPDSHYTGGLIGTKDTLHLASLSSVRTRKQAETSSQQLITYYLKTCKSILGNQEQSTCLWRKTSPVIDQNMEELQDYVEFVLLENVENFELLYYNLPTNEWLSEWKTGLTEKNYLPSAISMKFDFRDKRKLIKQETTLTFHQQFILPVPTGESK